MDIQNFYARILNYNAENANFDEKLYFKPLVAGLILDISESRYQ
jgi:hypothetical protein